MQMDTINLNITGDVFLGRRIEALAVQDPRSLFDEKVLRLFSNSDFNIVNLESPLTKAPETDQLIKTGPNLKAGPETIGVLEVLNTNLATLANNHIFDYGQKGLSDTMELLQEHHIQTVGAGESLKEASGIFLQTIRGITFAVVNIAENEWCNASESRGGANPMDIVANTRSIRKAKEMADHVILIIHGGHEFYYSPSPRMVEQYRFYAEQGASLIAGHHSHCVSGYEIYQGVPIFYGLGNFLFDANTQFEGWYEGMVLNVQLKPDKKVSFSLHPYSQCRKGLKVELLEGTEKARLEQTISQINSILADPEKTRQSFNEFIARQQASVLSMFSTSYFINNRYFRSAIRKSGLERFFLRRSQLKSVLNYFRCESHKEISNKVLMDYIYKNKK